LPDQRFGLLTAEQFLETGNSHLETDCKFVGTRTLAEKRRKKGFQEKKPDLISYILPAKLPMKNRDKLQIEKTWKVLETCRVWFQML
jgi:hypothetical protein